MQKIYRLIPTKFTNDLFEFGNIRLTNIKKWRYDDNKAIEDKQEGYFNNKVIDTETKATIVVNNIDNPNNEIMGNLYGMSFSTEINLGTCVDFAFDGFWVSKDNIFSFANSINMHIPCPSDFIFNKCKYVKGGLYQRRDSFRKNGMISERGTLLIGNGISQIAMNNQNDPNHLFTKDSYYSCQQEFRIIWQLKEDYGEYLYIKCPVIKQYCNRITGVN